MTTPLDPPPLEIYMLGLVDFDDAQRLQRRLVYDLGERGAGAALILCEHPPTISVGRSGSRMHIAPDDRTLQALGVHVHWVNRGGGVVLHLPGQVSAYFALTLDRLNLNLQTYVDNLHTAVVAVLDEFELKGSTRPDQPGIFLGQSRVATVGVAVNRWVTYHGLTLNVGPYLEPFAMLLDEPGIAATPMRQTSMESRRQRLTPMPKVRESLVRNLELAFGLARHHVYTQHPMIRRKVLAHVYAPTPG